VKALTTPTTPRFEGFAVGLLALYALAFAAILVFRIGSFVAPGSETLAELSLLSRALAAAYAIAGLAVNVIFAVWLFRHAGHTGRPRWTWSVLALFTGIVSAVLYFLLPIYDELLESKAKDI
jgi:hypothetical protein